MKKNIIINITCSILLILFVIIIDQITKNYILKNNISATLIEGVLEISYTKNRGGAFGVGQDNTFTFIITNIVVLGIIVRFLYIQRDMMDNITKSMLLIILGGGLGNLIDRIFRGFVIDFIRIFPKTNFPNFNIADICITMGWFILMLIFINYTYKEIKASKSERNRV